MGEIINKIIGFIGAGNMASSIGTRILKKGLIQNSQLFVSDPSEEILANWKKLGVNTSMKNATVAENSDIIIFSVKPHILFPAIDDIKKTLTDLKKVENKLFVSIIAGITMETLESNLSDFKGSRVVRVMPNTPMLVGEGCSVYCPGKNVTSDDLKNLEMILSSCGVCTLLSEHMIDAFTALAGSGPAFVSIAIEALSDGGVLMGLPRAMATQFAAQTVYGSAKMVLETGKHTGILKDEVCSPGGTTIAGVYALEKAGVRAGLMSAIEAAALKAIQLGEKNKKD